MADGEELLRELLEVFRLEAQDHLGALSALLVALEQAGVAESGRLLETVFRRMHTLKGAAHAVNLMEVARACQDLEDLLADLKRGDRQLDLVLFDRLHAEVDALAELIRARQQGAGGAARPGSPDAGVVAERASMGEACVPDRQEQSSAAPQAARPDPAAAVEVRLPPPAKSPGAERPGSGDETVRVSTRLLASLLLQAEELVSAKLAASQLSEECAAASAEFSRRSAQAARLQESARRLKREAPAESEAARLAGLIEEECRAERQSESRLRALQKLAERHLRVLKGTCDPLLEDLKRLHLLPFSSLTDPFAKLVRDLARELDKEAEIGCRGAELEIDRRILAELKEPLLHILRNVMDHGLEPAKERRLKGKPARGQIRIDIRLQDANRAQVVIADDGRGMDPAQLKREALRLELATPEALERMPDPEALQLAFASGLSTSPVITSLSGRGVGLAIVRESLERLGGHVTVDSRPGAGCEFRLTLPLSFSMMRALLVETAGRDCLLPAACVELTARVAPGEIKSVENRDTVLLGGELVSLVSLARLLELEPGEPPADGFQPVVLLGAAGKRIAFAVDRVLEVQEILVKPLGPQLARVRNVAGATVLGSGRVVPILNVGDLFRCALQGAGGRLSSQGSARPRPKRLSVLVAEDSITSRTLLKNILESAGFLVRTAVDGLDALSQLKTEGCDVVISDVEMPRMDGFQLTAAIRADGRWDALPVVLVTGLESRADRERGIDVGANAYLVKSSFDQLGLIEIIQKLA